MRKKWLTGVMVLLLAALSIGGYYLYQIKDSVDRVLQEEDRADQPEGISFSVETLNFKQPNHLHHLTHLHNVRAILPAPFTLATTGGFVRGDEVNRSINSLHLTNPVVGDRELFFGYRDGFIHLSGDYINHFNFGKQINKCISADRIYCLMEQHRIIYSDPPMMKTFYPLLTRKEVIIDIAYHQGELHLLTSKELLRYHRGAYRKITLPEQNQISKLRSINGTLLLISDRQIYQQSGEKIITRFTLPAVTDAVFYRGHYHFSTLQGAVFKGKEQIARLKHTIHKLQVIDDTLHILTKAGHYTIKGNEKLSAEIIAPRSLSQNMVSAFSLRNNQLNIGYFNRGIDLYQITTGVLTPSPWKLNGINEIYPSINTTYIATTSGFYDTALRRKYTRKDGLLGRNVSKILTTGNDLYIATEGGLSLRSGERFESIYGWHGLISNRVNTLAYNPSTGIVYAGTLGGLSLVKGLKVIQNYRNLKTPWITALSLIDDTLLIGSYGSGITQLKDQKLKQITSGRVFINPNATTRCGMLTLWGTLKQGILIYNIKTGKYRFYNEGPSENITALHCAQEYLFVGSDFGFWQIGKGVLQ